MNGKTISLLYSMLTAKLNYICGKPVSLHSFDSKTLICEKSVIMLCLQRVFAEWKDSFFYGMLTARLE